MSLMDDIITDQADVDSKLVPLLIQLVQQATDDVALSRNHNCVPVVAALVGVANSPMLFQVSWSNAHEQKLVFEEINNQLIEAGTSATIMVLPSYYKSKGRELRSIFIQIRTHHHSQTRVLPYEVGPGGITWGHELIEDGAKLTLISVPESN